MATTTLTPHQRAVRSTVSWKVLMALTGLVYLAISLALSTLMNVYNKRVALVER